MSDSSRALIIVVLFAAIIGLEFTVNMMVGSIWIIGGFLKAMLIPVEAIFDAIVLVIVIFSLAGSGNGGETERR